MRLSLIIYITIYILIRYIVSQESIAPFFKIDITDIDIGLSYHLQFTFSTRPLATSLAIALASLTSSSCSRSNWPEPTSYGCQMTVLERCHQGRCENGAIKKNHPCVECSQVFGGLQIPTTMLKFRRNIIFHHFTFLFGKVLVSLHRKSS